VSDSPQGPGWWQASDGKWYPPEQAPGGATAGAAPGGAPAGGGGGLAHLNIGDAFSYGWNKYTQNLGQLILAAIIGFAIAVVLVIIGYVVLIATALAGSDPAECGFNSAGDFVCTGGSSGPSIFLIAVGYAVFFFLYFIGFTIFDMLMVRAGLLVTSGEQVEPGKLLSTENLGQYMLANVLIAAVIALGTVLCFIPGIILAIAYWIFGRFFGFFILDKGQGAVESIKSSYNMVRANLGNILLFLIAATVLNWIGAAICFVGLLVTVPLTAIAAAYVYRTAQGQPIAA
jgi:uncharacterized membrane protein